MKPRVLLASRNGAKVREIRELLSDDAVELVGLDEVVPEPMTAEEDLEKYETFVENALAKARFFAEQTRLPTLADDSGLSIHALDGQPGVRSKRFAETRGWRRDDRTSAIDTEDRVFPENDRDALNNRLALEALADRPLDQRMAHFACAAAFARPDGRRTAVALGTCSGRIAGQPSGSHGFGYDPIFFVPELDATFGQVDAATKHRYSHRAQAFRALSGSLNAALADLPVAASERG